MKINLDIGQTNLMNFGKVQQSSFSKNDNDTAQQIRKVEQKDSVTISPQGKKNNLLDNLMKQKMRIEEQKNALVSATLEKGGDLDTIKSQLELYAEQTKNIDEQIADITAKETEQQTEKLKTKVNEKPKTEEEIENEQLSKITNLSTNLQQTQALGSIQNKMEGSIRVTQAELKADKKRGLSGEVLERKERIVDKMSKNISDLNAKNSENLSELTEKTKESNKVQERLPENENKDSQVAEENFLSSREDNSAEKSLEEKVVE